MNVLLGAITAIKADVAVLAARMKSAEDRIDLLEAATFTPPASPALGNSDNETGSAPVTEVLKLHEDAPRLSTGLLDPGWQNNHSCTLEQPCDIVQHLRPISNSLTSLSEQLCRIELSITQSASSASQLPSILSRSDIQKEEIVDYHALEQRTALQPQATIPGEVKIKSAPQDSGKQNRDEKSVPREAGRYPPYIWGTSPEDCHIFGQPSTPSRRYASFNAAKSPFSTYKEDRSPFTQLAARDSGKPSWLTKSARAGNIRSQEDPKK